MPGREAIAPLPGMNLSYNAGPMSRHGSSIHPNPPPSATPLQP
ncbi:hypothetical protein ACQ4M4_02815 [Leptolyngbya sp. AN02str]